MAGRPKSIDNSKVFDVAKPGNAKPMGTSRPVIVSHAAPIKDATIVNVTDGTESSVSVSAPSASRRIIKPLSAEPETEQPEAAKSSITVLSEPEPEETVKTAPLITKSKSSTTAKREATDIEAQVVAAETAQPEPETSEAETQPVDTLPDATEEPATDTANVEGEATGTAPAPEETDSVPAEAEPADAAGDTDSSDTDAAPETESAEQTSDGAGSEAASVDALAEASGKTKEDQKKADEQAKKDAALQGLIDSKKYFVPLAHDSSQKKGGSGAVVALLVLILLAAGAYAAIDAKVIKTGIDLPYHLFKQ